MKNRTLESIKQTVQGAFVALYGYCGLADGDNFAMLNSGGEGENFVVTIKDESNSKPKPEPKRNQKLFNYDVFGTGRFPLDMLRYDRSHPTTQSDVMAMGGAHDARAVNLTALNKPDAGRWASMGWQVKNLRKVDA